MVWMQDLMMRIMKEETDKSKAKGDEDRRSEQYFALRSFFQDSWIQVPDGETPSRVMKPRALRQNGSSPPQVNCGKDHDAVEVEPEGHQPVQDANVLQASAVYMPYFCFSTCHNEARDKLKDPERLKAYQTLLDGYEDSVIHESPTLDEWYYHFAMDKKSAEDRSMRNREQVVTKFLKEHERAKVSESLTRPENTDVAGGVSEIVKPAERSSDDHWIVLRVNQIWIWTFANSKLSITLHTCQLADAVHY
jgi:hypothetical protein